MPRIVGPSGLGLAALHSFQSRRPVVARENRKQKSQAPGARRAGRPDPTRLMQPTYAETAARRD